MEVCVCVCVCVCGVCVYVCVCVCVCVCSVLYGGFDFSYESQFVFACGPG
jgi:hypothetical protein